MVHISLLPFSSQGMSKSSTFFGHKDNGKIAYIQLPHRGQHELESSLPFDLGLILACSSLRTPALSYLILLSVMLDRSQPRIEAYPNAEACNRAVVEFQFKILRHGKRGLVKGWLIWVTTEVIGRLQLAGVSISLSVEGLLTTRNDRRGVYTDNLEVPWTFSSPTTSLSSTPSTRGFGLKSVSAFQGSNLGNLPAPTGTGSRKIGSGS